MKMPGPDKYKYRLKETFIAVFGGNATKAMNSLTDSGRIAEGTLRRDISLRMYETGEIPDSRLIIYASFLGVIPEFLKADYLQFLSTKNLAA